MGGHSTTPASARPLSARRWVWRRRVAAGAGTALAVALALAGLGAAHSRPGTIARSAWEANERLFNEVFRIVSTNAVDSVSDDDLYVKAARGLVHELGDPYADLYSPAELKTFLRNGIGNSYGGLGMGIEDAGGGITVTAVFSGTPAADAGVQIGDRIAAVDGESTAGWSVDRVSAHTTGPVGTTVDVTFERPGMTTPLKTHLVRARVHVPSVPYAVMLDAHTGYVPLQHFSETAPEEAAAAVARLRRSGATAFVLDLRGNGGGDLDAALAVTNVFLPADQPVVSVHYRGQPAQVLKTRATPVEPSLPLAVLIDGGTASASEIVAGALQDHDRAVLVGTPSFGKGLVQTMYPLEGGWAVKMTTGRWYTPSGRSIHRNRTLVDNRLVDDDSSPPPHTLANARAGRPQYHSDSNRTLYGGGGIVPDVFVASDTLSTAVQQALRPLGEHASDARRALNELAQDITPGVAAQRRADFPVDTNWRTTYYAKLRTRGVVLDRDAGGIAGPTIDGLIAREVARRAFGDSAAFRRSVTTDAALRSAISLLHGAASEHQVLAAADVQPG